MAYKWRKMMFIFILLIMRAIFLLISARQMDIDVDNTILVVAEFQYVYIRFTTFLFFQCTSKIL